MSRYDNDYNRTDDNEYNRRDDYGQRGSYSRRDDYDDFAGNNGNSDSYIDFDANTQSPRRPRQSNPARGRAPRRATEDYDNDYYDEDMPQKPTSFRKRHPVLMNALYLIITAVILMWMLMWFLDYWTFHGEERVVPDVKGQAYETAAGNIDISGLNAVISDSVFDSYSRPGTVVEQAPIPGARIKKGGNIYLTVVAFSPKLITVPDFYNVSVRQARSMFEGLGIKEIREVPVTSEYAGLVLGARFNGVALQPGARIPVSAVVTIEVGTGLEEIEETGANIDSIAIDNAIEELNIE